MTYRYFVLFLLLSVFMLYGSCSFAYTIDDFISFTSQVRDLNSNFNTCTNQILNNSESLKRDLSSYNPTTIIVTNANWTASFNTTILRFRSTPIKIDIYTNSISIQSAYRNRSQWYEALFLNGVWQVSNASSDIQSCANTSTFGLIDLDNQSFDNWYNNYFNGKFIPPYTGPVFTPSNNGTIQVIASNNLSENMTRLPFTYSGQSDWTLGYLTDYDGVYSIFGNFGPMFYREGQLYTEAYQNAFSYNIYSGTNNGGLLFDPTTGRISIKREKLVNKQAFSLLLQYRLNNGDVVEDIGDYHYYAYFYNLNISSGDLMSPELNSTVDIGMLNALDEYFNYSSGDSDNINYSINELLNFSGDLFSGDLFSGDILGKIGYNNYSSRNEYSLTLYDFYRRIIGVLMDDSTSSYIEFQYRGNTYRYNSSDFKTPDSAFKTFVSGFIIVLFSIGIVKRLAVLFKRMAILDYVGISKSFDVDDSNFL